MTFSRRRFLKLAAGSSLALPLLQMPMLGRAQTSESFPTRLIVFYQPNGTKRELWQPREGSTETNFELGPIMAPLEAHKGDLVILDGLDMTAARHGPGGPHQRGMASVLTGAVITEGDFVGGDGRRAGWGGGLSVDQHLVNRLQPPTALGSLELGVRVKEAIPRSRIIYRGVEQPVAPENDPVAAYARTFGNISGEPMDEAAVQRLLLRRKSVLDFVHADFAKLSSNLASEDRRKLEHHADSLRDLERRLGVIAERSENCLPAGPMPMDVMGEAEFRGLLRAQIDIMVNAMACDVTRIGSIQCSSAVNALRFTFMGLNDHEGHSLSHSGDSNMSLQGQWEQMLIWYSEQMNYLLDKLDSIPEGSGTMLDNTLVLAVNEISRGNTHSHSGMPFFLAGGASGRLRTGRFLQYEGVPHNHMLLSVLHLMGLDDTSFGDPEFCDGPLVGLA